MRRPPRTVRKSVILRQGCWVEESRLRLLGGNPIRRLPLVNGVVVDLPEGADLRLSARLPEVARVDDDLPLRLVGQPGDPGQRRLRPRGRWRWLARLRDRWPCGRPAPPAP